MGLPVSFQSNRANKQKRLEKVLVCCNASVSLISGSQERQPLRERGTHCGPVRSLAFDADAEAPPVTLTLCMPAIDAALQGRMIAVRDSQPGHTQQAMSSQAVEERAPERGEDTSEECALEGSRAKEEVRLSGPPHEQV